MSGQGDKTDTANGDIIQYIYMCVYTLLADINYYI